MNLLAYFYHNLQKVFCTKYGYVSVQYVVNLDRYTLDEMGNRIDDLEKNISDLMTTAGVEGPEK